MENLSNILIDCMQVCDRAKFIEKIVWYRLKKKILIENEIGKVKGYVTEIWKSNCECKKNKLGNKTITKNCSICKGKGYVETFINKLVIDVKGVEFRYVVNQKPDIKFLGYVEPEEVIESEPNFTYKCLFILLLYFDNELFNKLMTHPIIRSKYHSMKDEINGILTNLKVAA